MARLLITGANGYIASHVVAMALESGHDVCGTVRDPADDARCGHLRSLPGAGGRLRLVRANLTEADPFTAHSDVDCIIHLASPYALDVKDPARDLVAPAVAGTEAVLVAAAASPRVRRVVLTSSVAAITDEPDGRVLTEADWNLKSSLTRNPYYYSKVMAERAAHAFMAAAPRRFDLAVINPFVVIGPALSAARNESPMILADMAMGKYPGILDLHWGLVDVRDVARAHLVAIDPARPAGRYLCAAETLSMRRVAQIMTECGYGHASLQRDLTSPLATAMIRLVSLTQPRGVGSYLRSHLGRVPRFDNARIRNQLGIAFTPAAQSVADTMADLARWGHVPARPAR